VLLLSARFTGEAAQPVAVALHGTIRAPRPLYAACLRVTHTPALAAPLLSVFLTDRDGTILLYNVEMTWRQEQGQAGGGRMELRPTDESSIVVVDHGKAVGDLNVVSVPGPEDSLLAYSPSLSTMYLLSWS
ncbi:WD40 repeat-containing protein SMU1, partial [Trypanosoma grayi]|uniref:WD40 repeat-containing protein SMU1 n=1 Tax=Trypanosoma grayi TaxID=71804 RepID=UPI0004F41BCD